MPIGGQSSPRLTRDRARPAWFGTFLLSEASKGRVLRVASSGVGRCGDARRLALGRSTGGGWVFRAWSVYLRLFPGGRLGQRSDHHYYLASDADRLADDGASSRWYVTVRHVRRLIAERRIPFLKVDRLVRFDPQDVTNWLAGARVEEHRSA